MKLFEEPKLDVILFDGGNILLDVSSLFPEEDESNDTPKA